MNKRNFKFYLTVSEKTEIKIGKTINDAGVGENAGADSARTERLELKGQGVYVDLNLSDPYHAVFFYDSNDSKIGNPQYLFKSRVFLAPPGAKYCRLRFSLYDPGIKDVLNSNVASFIHQAYLTKPHYTKLEKRTAKDSGQEYYRESLSGSLKFVGKDFDIVYNASLDDTFNLLVYLKDDIFFRGNFSKIDCKLDFTKKICEPKIKTKDAYENILEHYDDKYDLVKMKLPLSSITCVKRPFLQIYCLGASTVTNVFNGQAWETEVSAPVDSMVAVSKAGFSYASRVLREIYIEEAKLSEVNGIYWDYEAFNDYPVQHRRWYKTELDGTRTHYIELSVNVAASELEHAGVYRVGASSEPLYYVSNPKDVPSTMLSTAENGSLVGLAFTSDSNGVFVIRKDISYSVHARIVHNTNIESSQLLASDDFAMSNLSYKRTTPFTLSEDVFKQTLGAVAESTIYGINDYGEYFTPEFLPGPPSGSKYLPIVRSSWANTSIWLTYNYDLINHPAYYQHYSLRDCFNIGHVIKGLLNKMGSSVTHEPLPEYSSFLYAKAQPLDGIDRFYVYITQKSNAVRGTYDQAAQRAEVSLKSIMEMLRDCFRCYWYIDNGKLKIEHVSFFKNGLSYKSGASFYDLTLPEDGFNGKPILYGQSALEYDTSELLREYSFAYADESQVPFSGVKLEVDAPYVSGTEDINVGEFSADLDYMQISADSVSQDGFALLCPKSVIVVNGPRKLEVPILKMRLLDNGQPYDITVQNGHASWAYLAKLYSFDMPGMYIKSNVLMPFAAQGIKNNLTQTVLVPNIPDMIPYSAVKTSAGKARVKGINEHFESGYLELDLAYPLS